jgi:hypothetical protein
VSLRHSLLTVASPPHSLFISKTRPKNLLVTNGLAYSATEKAAKKFYIIDKQTERTLGNNVLSAPYDLKVERKYQETYLR